MCKWGGGWSNFLKEGRRLVDILFERRVIGFKWEGGGRVKTYFNLGGGEGKTYFNLSGGGGGGG